MKRRKNFSAASPRNSPRNEHAALLIRLDHFVHEATHDSKREVEDLTALEQAARDFIDRGPDYEGNRLNFVAYLFAEKEVLLDLAVDYARRSLELAEEAKWTYPDFVDTRKRVITFNRARCVNEKEPKEIYERI